MQSVLVEEVADVKPLLESLPIKQQVWEETERPTGRLYEDPQGIYVPLMPDGEEHHHWKDGSEYYGEWRDGQPSGRGIFVSQTGLVCSCSVLLLRACAMVCVCLFVCPFGCLPAHC